MDFVKATVRQPALDLARCEAGLEKLPTSEGAELLGGDDGDQAIGRTDLIRNHTVVNPESVVVAPPAERRCSVRLGDSAARDHVHELLEVPGGPALERGGAVAL